MTVLEIIDNIENNIFDYQIENIMNDIANLFSNIIENNIVDLSNSISLNQLNLLMSKCLSAMNNEDYLLVADQLEYNLKPMLGG